MAEPKEIPTYTAMYYIEAGYLHKKSFIGNDHEDVLKQIKADEGDKVEIVAIWIGDIPDPIWIG
ncbi:hypothetical protein KIP58_21880 [Xanthomonas campestris pv. campestris]|uniref:hypothetical protein n=1 Tax=Xanthomonas campestris TaxID=339 RepID=UPI001F1BAB6A|nr:hypothetical protein [Xanthomonas campestris]MCF8861638.1 hypothetical protein [Xanthomonas campestris pv. campestris]